MGVAPHPLRLSKGEQMDFLEKAEWKVKQLDKLFVEFELGVLDKKVSILKEKIQILEEAQIILKGKKHKENGNEVHTT